MRYAPSLLVFTFPAILASVACSSIDRAPVWAGPTQDPVPDPTQLFFTGKKEFDQLYHDVGILP